MGDHSKIEWTSSTWNPIRARNKETGNEGWFCIHVSDGCKNCYAETMNVARRWDRGTGLEYKAQNLKRHEIYLDEKTLSQPLRWKSPRKIFVCSMTDLFGEFVPFTFIGDVYQTMGLAQQHIFQILTKRPERRLDFYEWAEFNLGPDFLPLPNVWEGTSVEDQATADERIPHLLRCPAAVRWLSAEPLLGPVDLGQITAGVQCVTLNCLTGMLYDWDYDEEVLDDSDPDRTIHWVVVGGESGPKARPFNVAWAREIMDQCQAAGVPCFMKQMGSFVAATKSELYNWGQRDSPITGSTLRRLHLKSSKGGDSSEWPRELRVREYPAPHHESTPTS